MRDKTCSHSVQHSSVPVLIADLARVAVAQASYTDLSLYETLIPNLCG
jgi:hypothetical protein